MTKNQGPIWGLIAVVVFFTLAEFCVEAKKALRQGQTLSQFASRYESKFFQTRNARTILAQTTVIAVASLGMTLIIMSGGVDLSAGTTTALCAVATAYGLRENWGVPLALAAALGCGVLVGSINGVLVGWMRLTPFIATLGSMTVVLGAAKLLASETTIYPKLGQTPHWLPNMVSPVPELAGFLVPNAVWLTLGLAGILTVLIKKTILGRIIIAIGSNEQAARLCGIRVDRWKIAIYGLAGLLVGAAGILQFARLSSGNPTSGLGLELKMIAAVVVGGGSLKGGRGSMFGALVGALIMSTINSGCVMLEVRNPIQDMVIGVIIIATVLLDQFRQKR